MGKKKLKLWGPRAVAMDSSISPTDSDDVNGNLLPSPPSGMSMSHGRLEELPPFSAPSHERADGDAGRASLLSVTGELSPVDGGASLRNRILPFFTASTEHSRGTVLAQCLATEVKDLIKNLQKN